MDLGQHCCTWTNMGSLSNKFLCFLKLIQPNRVSFYYHDLTLIPAWISNHMCSKVWDEITDPFPNFTGGTIKVWEWISNFIPHFVMDVITYPCWDLSYYQILQASPTTSSLPRCVVLVMPRLFPSLTWKRHLHVVASPHLSCLQDPPRHWGPQHVSWTASPCSGSVWPSFCFVFSSAADIVSGAFLMPSCPSSVPQVSTFFSNWWAPSVFIRSFWYLAWICTTTLPQNLSNFIPLWVRGPQC